MKKPCSKCKIPKEPHEFHGGLTKKSKCISCVSEEYFCKKQEKLKAIYDDGDTKIDICKCGNYYVNEINRGKGFDLKTRCASCAIGDNALIYQRRVGEVVLREQVKTLRQLNKSLEEEIVILRQLVGGYRKLHSNSESCT